VLKNKNAVITGGSRGIGAAIALAMAKAGACVAITYKSNYAAANDTLSLLHEHNIQSMALAMEVTDQKSVRNTFNKIDYQLGGIDILVNNAGINRPTDFDQITCEDWDEILAVNLKGPFICCQEILPAFRQNGGGSIINIGSVSGQYGGPRTAHYAASKAALISLGQVVARFGAKDNIRCNTIAAGLIESEMATAGLANKNVNKMLDSILLERLGTADDVAQSVVFLASNLSEYITAQTINVNGGLYF